MFVNLELEDDAYAGVPCWSGGPARYERHRDDGDQRYNRDTSAAATRAAADVSRL
ncbi:hypothetical protein MAHJHV55_54850 [Mycobacterium avium subsp. hominissuis]